ncbi:leucine rich repeat domain-containing protein [Colletotrichum godetiae]|uniref:Leucine rich repeat domain-containing protein n=1 Tax=Colletotrichum godetiae TaxID=1209918 RepID=A0AAJ0AI62_9PEZI|nr:leucine rich repeat domain-containing protein [Colletotrichum godetiae]KAK1674343.1 leucine rich repeat domain-containing protein [Colletotrichum godetiae]
MASPRLLQPQTSSQDHTFHTPPGTPPTGHNNPQTLIEYKMDSPEPHRPATPEKNGRSSFSSIRENDSDLAQTFTSSKVSSYAQKATNAVFDDSSASPSPIASPSLEMTEVQFMPPVTHPSSRLHGGWYPASSFKGWKQINVKGKTASKSFSDLQALHMSWSTPPPSPKGNKPVNCRAPMERLPLEILGSIIELLVLDIPPPYGTARRNVDLMSLLLTSRSVHAATLNTLYKHITIPHSRIFRKFLSNITTHPALGTIVRRIDFSHFNNATLFESASERKGTRNLTEETLLQCLELTPHLQEFLAMEHIDDDLGAEVLQKLFFGMPRLQALDFAGCTSPSFKNSFASLVDMEWPEALSITRLSLHKCLTLPPALFEKIMPRLTNVTHLDLAQTKITDRALQAIPKTAKITHLNLAKCTLLTAPTVINFLATHPAVRNLVYLSVATDARSHQLLDVDDVSQLIPLLPKTLRSLSLKGSRMDDSHLELLRPLTKYLEELAVGRDMDVNAAAKLLEPADEKKQEEPHMIRYLDLSDLWGSELDIVDLFSSRNSLLKPSSVPLEVVEISEQSFKSLSRNRALERVGWSLQEIGSRCWMVRMQDHRKDQDRGYRWWKIGADNWGMRKIPVARAEVGGMYGSFMFGRKL